MLASAFFHLGAGLIMTISTGNPDYINMFNVIGVSWFIPELSTGLISCLLSLVFVTIVASLIYVGMRLRVRTPKSSEHTVN